MNETIDKSEYLPRFDENGNSIPLVNYWRMKQGDLKQLDNGRIEKKRGDLMLDTLQKNGFLTDGEHFAAMVYMRVRGGVMSRLGYSKMRESVLALEGSGGLENSDLYQVYKNACIAMTQKQCRLVNYVCDNDVYVWASNSEEHIKKSFEVLKESVDNTMNKCKNDNYREGANTSSF